MILTENKAFPKTILTISLNTEPKLNVHKTFELRPVLQVSTTNPRFHRVS